MKLVLLFPPPGNLSQPYTSLPALTAFMRREGHEVVQRDVGVEVIRDLLTAPHLRQVTGRVKHRLDELEARQTLSPEEEAECDVLHCVSVGADYVVDRIDEAKRVLRSATDFYDFERFRWAANLVGLGMDLLSAPFWPSSFGFNHGFTNYVMPHFGWSASDLMAAAADETQNVFLSYFEGHTIPSILATSPDLVGISATYPGQIIPSLTLARQLKAARPDLHVCLGGAVLAGMHEELQRCPMLFRVLDSIVVCEGEHALSALADVVGGNSDLGAVPNLLYLDGDEVHATARHVEDVNALPSPDYGGLPLDLYLTPEITALLPTERGCYWGRCAFCTISAGMRHKYRPRPIERVVEDMKSLHRQLGTSHFFLSTDAISPARMKALARAISSQKLGFTWQTEARLEKALTLETCRELVRGGCRHLRMGLESGSQPVLDAMDKGLQVSEAARVIRNCHEAGISVHVCLILGFPAETREQARETLAFIEANRQSISSLTYGLFALYKDSRVYRRPEDYGVSHMAFPPDDWLNGNIYVYATSRGMTREEVESEAYAEGVRSLSRSLPFALPLTGCCMAAAHPLHFYTQWAYLPYLSYYGVRHYADLPFTVHRPQSVDLDGALEARPRLGSDVVSRNGSSRPLALFHAGRGIILRLEPEAGTLLSLCDGRATVREIAGQFAADREGTERVRAHVQGLQLCRLLLQEEFLQDIAGRGVS